MSSSVEFGQLLKRGSGDAALTDRERLIWHVGQFATDVEMGGLSTFLYNVSPNASVPQSSWSRLRETIQSLSVIGATGAANVLASLVTRLEAPAQDDGTWSGFLDARGVNLDDREDELEGYDDLFRCLDDHLAKLSP
jgi:hypothetical protein